MTPAEQEVTLSGTNANMADIRGVIPLRPDNGEPAGFEGHIHFFTDRENAAKFCPGAKLVDCVLTECDWRERPTCPGDYCSEPGAYEWFSEWDVQNWGKSRSHFRGWVFGPIPPVPEIPQELQR